MSQKQVDPNSSVPGYASFPEILAARATHQPERTAFVFLYNGEQEQARLTFGQLDQQAKAVAAALQGMGHAGKRALLQYPPGLDFAVALFGCMYAAVTAVPAYPPKSNRSLSRLQAIAEDAEATIILTTEKIKAKQTTKASHLPVMKQCQWIATDGMDEDRALKWQDPQAKPADLALMQYTSGSLGDPKGVMVSHRNLIHNAHMAMLGFGHSEKTVFAGWLPLFHDMGLIGNLLQPVYVGIPAVLMAPAAFVQKPFRWLKAITDFKATTSGAPDSAYRLCAQKVTETQKRQLDLSTWDVAFSGAEPVRADTLKLFCEAFSSCGFNSKAFYPCYGMAEATLFISGGLKWQQPILKKIHGPDLLHHRATPAFDEGQTRTLVSCGRGWMDQQIVIVDPETNKPCGSSQIGEIWVRGSHIASGYWKRPEETRQAFKGQLDKENKERFLKTGDLGFVDQGELYVTGRLKNLIIIRGRNHYPQDLQQTALNSHPALRTGGCAAFSIEHNQEERLVIAAEVNRTDLRNLDVAGITTAIREAIAENHELNLHGVILLKPGALPRTTSGKIGYHGCRTQFLDNRLSQVGEWREARDSSSFDQQKLPQASPEDQGVEAWLLDRIAEHTGETAASLSSHRSFSRQGMDSLEILRFQHEVETEFGVRITASEFFSDLTPRSLATFIQAAPKPPKPTQAHERHGDEKAEEGLLSAGQESLWFAQQFQPQVSSFNVFFAVRIFSKLNTERLQQCVQEMVVRHVILRTRYPLEQGRIRARISDMQPSCFTLVQSHQLSEEQFQQTLETEAYRPFDLQKGLLFRVLLYTRPGGEQVLLVNAHHIIVDLASLILITEELVARYQGQNSFSVEEESSSIEHQDFVYWQRDQLKGPRSEDLWKYWKQQGLAQGTPASLPNKTPRPALFDHRGAAFPLTIPTEVKRELKHLANEGGETLQVVLMTAFAVLLGSQGTPNTPNQMILGTLVSGRTRAAFASTIGYFSNPVPIKIEHYPGLPLKDLFKQVKSQILGALDHQDFPFPHLVNKLRPPRDPSRAPLFQIMFVHQQMHALKELAPCVLADTETRFSLGPWQAASVPMAKQVTRYDLTLYLIETNNGIAGHFLYNPTLFDRGYIASLAEKYQRLLSRLPLARNLTWQHLTDELQESVQPLLEPNPAPERVG